MFDNDPAAPADTQIKLQDSRYYWSIRTGPNHELIISYNGKPDTSLVTYSLQLNILLETMGNIRNAGNYPKDPISDHATDYISVLTNKLINNDPSYPYATTPSDFWVRNGYKMFGSQQ
jgi:hypothetical protein